MPRDFRAKQIRTTQIIASGGVGASNGSVGLLIYSSSDATNLQGGMSHNMTASVGTDVWMFVSGANEGKAVKKKGVVVFGGDVLVSGTFYADKMIVEVQEHMSGGLYVSGNLLVSGSGRIRGGLIVNDDGNKSGGITGDFRVESDGEDEALLLDSSANIFYVNKGETAFETVIGNTSDEALRVDAEGVVINEDSHADIDFRVESNSVASAIAVNAGTDKVTIDGGAAAADAVTIQSSNAAGGVDVNAGTGGITIDSTGTVSIDGADDMNFTITSSTGGEDLTIQQVGANDSSIIITAAGTGADAVKIDATAGDMVIAPSLADGKTLKLGKNGAVEVIIAPHGTAANEKYTVTNTSGDAADAISLNASAGGILINADASKIHLDAEGTGSDAIDIDSAGGLDVDVADAIELTTTSADGHIKLESAHTAGIAVHIDADANAGSIVDIDAGILDIDVTGNANIDAGGAFSVDAVGASNITANGALTVSGSTALNLASDSGEIDITTRQGSIDINAGDDVTIDAADNMTLTAGDNFNVNTSTADGKVTLYSAHTAGAAFHIDSDAAAGSILDIDAGILDIDVTGNTTIDAGGTFSIDGVGTSNITTHGNLALSGSDLVSIESDGGEIDITARQGNIDINATAGNVTIDSGGTFSVDGVGGSNVTTKGILTLSGSTKSLLTSTAATALAVQLDASHAAGGVDIRAGTSGVNIATNASGVPINIGHTTSETRVNDNLTVLGVTEVRGLLSASANLTVEGDANIAEYIKHSGDTDTFIRFQADNINFQAGGVDLLHLVEAATDLVVFNEGGADVDFRVETSGEDEALYIDGGNNRLYINKGETAFTTIIGSTNDEAIRVGAAGVIFNEDGHATNDFRVETDNKPHGLFVDAGSDQVLILSGGAATSYNEAAGGDVNFYVSGSSGTRGKTVKGTAVFGGDVHISGTITAGSGITGGSPGGSDTQLQFNDGGAFGGLAKLTWDDTNFLLGTGAATKLQFRDAGLFINSPADGHLDIVSDTRLTITGSGAVADAIALQNSNAAGGIDIDAGSKGITVDTTGILYLTSSNNNANAIQMFASAGGLSLVAAGAAGEDIDIRNTNGSITIVGGENQANAVRLHASNAAGGLDIDTGTGGVAIDTTGVISIDAVGTSNLTTKGALTVSGSSALNLASDSGEIDVTTRQGNIDINATAGNIDIDAGGTIDIDAAGGINIGKAADVAFDVDTAALDIDSSGAVNITTSGAASDITLVTAHTAGVAFLLDADANAGSIVDIDAGILQIDAAGVAGINSGDTLSLGTANSGVAVSIGHTTSETTINDNLSVTGDATISEYLYHGGDTDTFLRFKSDQVRLAAGGNTNLKMSTDAFLVLSGGAATSFNESAASDVAFHVSGSIGSRGTATRGAALFGGDLVVSGTLSVNRGQAGAGSVVTVTDDGKVGIGTDSPSYKLEVGGNMAVGEYIYHRADADTFIRFQADSVKVNVGNVDMISITEDGSQDKIVLNEGGADVDFRVESSGEDEAILLDAGDNTLYINKGETTFTTIIGSTNDEAARFGAAGIIFNEDGHATNDFRVESNNKPHAFFVDAGSDQVLVLSGGVATSFNEAGAADVNFYVSGSSGTRGTATRGTSVFGGDVHISGTITAGGGISGAVSAVANGADNRVATFSSSDALNGESNLTFDGTDLGVSAKVFHVGDTDTFINFTDDDINITVGNVSMLDFNEGANDSIVFNEGGADVDFRVESDDNTHMLFINGNTNRLSIGTAGNSPETTVHIQDATPSLRIQRSDNSQNSTIEWAGAAGVRANMFHLGTDNDLIISSWNGSAVEESLRFAPITRQILFNSGSSNGGTSPNEAAAADVSFYVSGTVDSSNSAVRGSALFGGDLVTSGGMYGKQLEYTYHTYNRSNDDMVFIGWFNNNESPSAIDDVQAVMPMAGRPVRVIVRPQNDLGLTEVGFHKASDGTRNISTTAVETIKNFSAADNTCVIFDFTVTGSAIPTANFAAGDVVGISIKPQGSKSPGDCNVTCIWEYRSHRVLSGSAI